MNENEEFEATTEYQKQRYKLTSFWQYFRAGIEYGIKLEKKKGDFDSPTINKEKG